MHKPALRCVAVSFSQRSKAPIGNGLRNDVKRSIGFNSRRLHHILLGIRRLSWKFRQSRHMRKAKFSMTIKRGHTIVKVYATPTRGFNCFTVSYYLGSKRWRWFFSDLEPALNEAEIVASKVSEGGVQRRRVEG